MPKKLHNVWCKLDDFAPFPVAYVDDKCVFDSCFNVSKLDSSVHKLLALCREGCGLGHTHIPIPITNDSVGVAIESNSIGILEVIFCNFFALIFRKCSA